VILVELRRKSHVLEKCNLIFGLIRPIWIPEASRASNVTCAEDWWWRRYFNLSR